MVASRRPPVPTPSLRWSQGLSGTGPKAGGPHYLTRFATEQTVTINSAAIGGNASLLTADD